jgi:hypothetical protein
VSRQRGAWVLCLLASLSACQAVAGIDERHYVAPGTAGQSAAGHAAAGGGRASTAGAGAVPLGLCPEYCKQVTDRCTADYAVYGDVMGCTAVCMNLEQGTKKDGPGSNTVGCRLNTALAISTEPAVDCPIAGPGGSGTCGDNCQSYCTLMSKACADTDYKKFWLGDVGDVELCVSKCRGLRDRAMDDPELASTDSRFSALNTMARDHNGDTIQCRLFHASAASAPVGAPQHCWHAALAPRRGPSEGVNPCLSDVGETTPRCKDYCKLITVACAGDLAPYESEAQCNKVCEGGFDVGLLTDDGSGGPDKNNTLGCRKTHAYNALVGGPSAVMHCAHSGPGGAGVCGDDCDSYCTLLERTCSAQFASIGGMAGCESSCKPLLGDKPLPYSVKLAKSGDSQLACRFLALTTARSEPKKMATSCDAAIGKGGC